MWEDERTLTGWYGGTGAPRDDVLRAGRGRDERDGRWVTQAGTGHAALARTREQAAAVIAGLTR